MVNAQVAVSLAAGSYSYYYGQRIPVSGTGGQFSMPVTAKLVKSVTTGFDQVSLAARQTSGGSLSALISASKLPYMQLKWVSAAAGTAGLIIPPSDPWPAPPAIVTSAFLNRNVRDAVQFLIYPPVFEAYDNATAQSIASATTFPLAGVPVSLDTTFADTWAAFGTASSTWTAPVSGLYYCYGQAALTCGANSLSMAAGLTVTSPLYNAGAAVTIWGGAQNTGTGQGNVAVVRKRVRLLGGDTIQLAAWQRDSSAASAPVITGPGTSASTSRLLTIWVAQ